MMANRDNPTGVSYPWPLKIVLFPGLFMQWLQFMFVGGRRYTSMVARTRGARSPAMTWVYSATFWAIIVFLIIPMWK